MILMKVYHKTLENSKPTAEKLALATGDIQARVNLQQLAAFHLGNGLLGGSAMVFIITEFDPDNPEHHVFEGYYRNPATGDRGGAIKFIQKLKRCSYERAIGYLDGWFDRALYQPEELKASAPVTLGPKPRQLKLALTMLRNEGETR